MKRTLDQDLQTFVALNDRIKAGGDDDWTIDRKDPLNGMLRAVPISQFALQGKMTKKSFAKTPLKVDGEDYGTLGFPNVTKLMDLAQAAGFGLNNETRYDTDVRLAFAIDGDRIDVGGNPMPQEDFKEFTGVTSYSNDVVLYKLHIYPPGGHFAPHVDTPHGEGHIASGIVVLGSLFTGGDLVIEHKEQTERVAGPNSFAVWYTDCKHWVEKVESGHRVVLQYDVFNKFKMPESDSDDDGEGEEEEEEKGFFTYIPSHPNPLATPAYLTALVKQVQESLALESTEDVALMLQHAYFNKGGLSPATLKGSDRVIWDALSASSSLQVALYPVVLRQTSEDDYSAGTLLDPEYFPPTKRLVRLIPGEDERGKTLEIFHNPGAEHTGNSAMDPDCAYLGAAILCGLKQ